jgi:hypothetical protein
MKISVCINIKLTATEREGAFYSVKMLFTYINCRCEWSDNNIFFTLVRPTRCKLMRGERAMIYFDIIFGDIFVFFVCVHFCAFRFVFVSLSAGLNEISGTFLRTSQTRARLD